MVELSLLLLTASFLLSLRAWDRGHGRNAGRTIRRFGTSETR